MLLIFQHTSLDFYTAYHSLQSIILYRQKEKETVLMCVPMISYKNTSIKRRLVVEGFCCKRSFHLHTGTNPRCRRRRRPIIRGRVAWMLLLLLRSHQCNVLLSDTLITPLRLVPRIPPAYQTLVLITRPHF